MPDCHKCPYNGHPTKRCLSCAGPSYKPSNHGKTTIPLDSVPESELPKHSAIPPAKHETSFATFMRIWLRLPRRHQIILAQTVLDESGTFLSVAKSLNLDPQTVSRNLSEITAIFPELNSFLRIYAGWKQKEMHKKKNEDI